MRRNDDRSKIIREAEKLAQLKILQLGLYNKLFSLNRELGPILSGCQITKNLIDDALAQLLRSCLAFKGQRIIDSKGKANGPVLQGNTNGLGVVKTLINLFSAEIESVQTIKKSKIKDTLVYTPQELATLNWLESLEKFYPNVITLLDQFVQDVENLKGHSAQSQNTGEELIRYSLVTQNRISNNNNNQDISSSNNNNNNRNILEPHNLSEAIESKNFEKVKEFIEADRTLLNPDPHHGVSPLHNAAAHGSAEIVNYFVKECGINPSLLDKNERSALHYAALHGNYYVLNEIFDEIRKTQQDLNKFIDQKDTDGNTALIYALQRGFF